jgi:hypothetical protein
MYFIASRHEPLIVVLTPLTMTISSPAILNIMGLTSFTSSFELRADIDITAKGIKINLINDFM